MCGLMSDLVICKFRKSIVIHDTECPYSDQASLNNTKLNHQVVILQAGHCKEVHCTEVKVHSLRPDSYIIFFPGIQDTPFEQSRLNLSFENTVHISYKYASSLSHSDTISCFQNLRCDKKYVEGATCNKNLFLHHARQYKLIQGVVLTIILNPCEVSKNQYPCPSLPTESPC